MEINEIADMIRKCKKCHLHKTRENAVPGEGNPNAEVMFIGEAPGVKEDALGRPFVGRAGKFLDELLEGVSLGRKDVFIGNVIKCRPPGNRNPTKEEINACIQYLIMQIEIISPKIICTLGNVALDAILGKKQISKVHGKIFDINGRKVIPMYHPAAGIRMRKLKNVMKEDMNILKKELGKKYDI